MKSRKKGSITVFLVVIFMSMLVFTGSIIDILRIAVAERRFENALQASSRSLLAQYNSELMGQFGIFGLELASSPNEAQAELERYLKANLKYKQGPFALDYQIKPESLAVEGMGNLTDKALFRQQVLEYMKYKAPVVITDNIIQALKNSKLENSLKFNENAKEVRAKAKSIKEKAKSLNQKLGNIARSVINSSANDLDNLMKELLKTKLELDDFKKNNGMDELESAQGNANETASQNGYQPIDTSEFQSLMPSAEQAGQRLEHLIQLIETEKGKIEELQSELDKIQEEIDDLNDDIYSLEQKIKAEKQPAKEDLSRLEQLKEEAAQLKKQASKYRTEIDERLALIKSYAAANKLDSINMQESNTNTPPHKEDQTNELNSLMEEIKSKLLIKTIPQGWLITAGEFSNAANEYDSLEEELYKNNGLLGNLSEDEGEIKNTNILTFLTALFQAVQDTSQRGVEKLYIIEYVMDKFTFLTSKTERGHYFDKGEVEYIISGRDLPYSTIKNTQLSVIADAMARMWFLRLAINSIDSFATSKIPHPVARLLWALAEGAIDSSIDMYHLLDGKEINIAPSLNHIKLKYSDHLRILLLLQSEEQTLQKMQQLVQVNILSQQEESDSAQSFRLSNCKIFIKTEAEASIKLIFLPVLNLDKLGIQKLSEGRYKIRKTVYIGY